MLLGAFALLPAAATAQVRDSAPRVSIGGGVGFALPFHGDFDFTPWAWDADVRVAMSRRVMLEAAVGEWRHVEKTGAENIQVPMPIGVIGHLEQATTRTQRTLQANVLATRTAGRLRVFAGGGVGLLRHVRRTRTVAERCSGEAACGTFESTVSSAAGTAQAVGGAEIRVAGGLNLYGQMRFVVPMTDLGGSELRVTSGLRWSFGR
jgi:hypothetical protein